MQNFNEYILMFFKVYLYLSCALCQHDPPSHCRWKTPTQGMPHDCEDTELDVELRQRAILNDGVWWERQKFFSSNWLLKISQFVFD
jgi:hypothetical protein